MVTLVPSLIVLRCQQELPLLVCYHYYWLSLPRSLVSLTLMFSSCPSLAPPLPRLLPSMGTGAEEEGDIVLKGTQGQKSGISFSFSTLVETQNFWGSCSLCAQRKEREPWGCRGVGPKFLPAGPPPMSVPGATVITVRLPQGTGEAEDAGGVQVD